jgi:fructan beta-fructosidase
MLRTVLGITVLLVSHATLWAAEGDILIADFEGEDYGEWKAEGTAFGDRPARGTLPGQMHVSGFKGKGLVNTFLGGDGATGTLTSPTFKIERNYITFLIGGGAHAGQTCMNLLVDGKVARTATGPNDRPGGSEMLDRANWDVKDLKGKQGALQIVDQATGGWGHINVDHIVQTDQKPKAPQFVRLAKEFTVENTYLVIPIKNGAKGTEITLQVEGTPVRRYGTELATSPEDIDWYAFFTIEPYQGKSARVTVARGTEEGFALVRQEDSVPGSETWYAEKLRPQLRFSQKVGWNNDPNGMVWLDGEWHLFFQHNPVGWKWGNMTWGHAVSKDLVHWQQLPNALFPGTMARGACFSGGALVDHKNTAGWKAGDTDVLVASLTDTGAGEAMAYSNDKGRTFTWYEGNPVVKHSGRDPKVIWYAYDDKDTPLDDTAKQLAGHWVMAVFDQHKEHGRNIAFYTSTDLKQWQKQSHLSGYFECAELFELPVDGNADDTRWVVYAADARYAIGQFDGKTFQPEHEGKHQVHWGPYYASQCFSNAPDGRVIQIGWARIAMPGMPFNQTFSLPTELTLKTTPKGVRMCAQPVQELEMLRGEAESAGGRTLTPDEPVRFETKGQLFDILVVVQPTGASEIVLQFGADRVRYDVAAQRLDEMPLALSDGKLIFRVVVDRPMYEVCGGEGDVYKTAPRKEPGTSIEVIQLSAGGGEAKIETFKVFPMRSIWKK